MTNWNKKVFGVDVSNNNGKVDVSKIAKSGISFLFAKASEGLYFQDQTFKNIWQDSAKHGIKVRGAYHYAHPHNDPIKEAKNFYSTVHSAGGFKSGDFAILDIEDIDPESHKLSVQQLITWITTYLKEISTLTGLQNSRILVYTGGWWWNNRVLGSNLAANHPLWVSGYVPEPPHVSGWNQATFWQYTDQGTIAGINGKADLSCFNGTFENLEELSGLKIFATADIKIHLGSPEPVITPQVPPAVEANANTTGTTHTVTLPKLSTNVDTIIVSLKSFKSNPAQIKLIQNGLNEALKSDLVVDGIWGAKSFYAYKQWQERLGLRAPNGIPELQSLTRLGLTTGFKAID